MPTKIIIDECNCIRCVVIAGVCKCQNSSCQKFSARKLFVWGNTLEKFDVATKMHQWKCYRIYEVSTMWPDAILVKTFLVTSSLFPDFRFFSLHNDGAGKTTRKIGRRSITIDGAKYYPRGNYRNSWQQKLNSTPSLMSIGFM